MSFEQRQTFKRVAERVAEKLLAELKAGQIAKIDIDVIRRALWDQPECPLDRVAFDELEHITVRRVVEGVS